MLPTLQLSPKQSTFTEILLPERSYPFMQEEGGRAGNEGKCKGNQPLVTRGSPRLISGPFEPHFLCRLSDNKVRKDVRPDLTRKSFKSAWGLGGSDGEKTESPDRCAKMCGWEGKISTASKQFPRS